jgi:hypothetical protein
MAPSARKKLLPLALCLGLAFLAPACCAQASDRQPLEEDKAALQRQVGFDDHLPNERNPAGLHIQFSKIGESNVEQGHFSIYKAYVPGASENQKYLLAVWRIGFDPQVLPGDVYVNTKGLLMVNKPRPDQENKDSVEGGDEDDFSIQAARGEPVRYLLFTLDMDFSVPGTVVPYPVEAKHGNCRLEARLTKPDGIAVLVYADGLPADSNVPYQSISGNESHPGSFHTNGSGHAAAIVLPTAAGKDAGVLKVSIAAKECSVSVEIPWGKGSYHPF